MFQNNKNFKPYQLKNLKNIKKKSYKRKFQNFDRADPYLTSFGSVKKGKKDLDGTSGDIEEEDYFNTDKLLNIDMEVNNLDDLIKLAKTYDPFSEDRYVINLQKLYNCLPILERLNAMVGMTTIKKNIVNLFFFYLQNFVKDDKGKNMKNTVIEGPPGSGKTVVASILGELYYHLGLVKNKTFIKVKITDLIGKYVGHTEDKVEKLFESAKGGVIFFDEAYTLGNKDRPTSFSKVAFDIINKKLTEDDVAFIIAGYKQQLQESFFSNNPGLYRRFPFRFSTDKYEPGDLKLIFEKMVKDDKWNISRKKPLKLSFFKKNYEYFPFSGGDMENLWHFTKIVHARRVFGKDIKLRKIITNKDIENAFVLFSDNEEVKKRNNRVKFDYLSLYT